MAVTALNNIIYGGPVETKITKDAKSLGEFILHQLDELGDKVILVDGLNGIELTARKFKETFIESAHNLRALGIKEGDAVGICSENRLEFAYTMFAAMLLNATLAPFNVTYTERELNHAYNLSKPKVIFASSATVKKVTAVAQKTSFVKSVVCFDDVTPSKFVIPYSKFLKLQKVKPKGPFKVQPTNLKENVVVILCSSGTTGLAKGVQITQNNILRTADGQFEQRGVMEHATVLSVIPWFHAYGNLTLMMLLSIGSRVVFLPKFQEHHFLNCIQQYEVDACLMVPPLMVFLAKHPMIDKYNLSSLKILLCGAAPLSKETADAVQQRIGVPIIRQGYGLSEATLSLLVQGDDHNKPGSVGTIRPDTYAKVIDTETGQPLGPNQRGELCFKGDVIMKGYVGDRKSTAETIDNDGWLHTGDIGYYDNDLDFYVVDRIKELIKYKGFQVPPAEIEALLLTHQKIKDAAVIGVPDEASGELPLAFVVKADTNLTQKDVIDFIAERASPAKRLHGGVRFIDDIPKNPSGKILRRVLRDMVKNEIKSKL